MFELNEINYDLKFSMKRIEQIEAVTGKPVMASLVQSGGMLGIGELKTYTAYGLINTDGNHISPAQGMNIAENLINDIGYVEVLNSVVEAVQRDCPFFFPAD